MSDAAKNTDREKPKPIEVPINQKMCLTIGEAAAYTGIGTNKLYQLCNDEDCPFVLYVGNRRLIKREKLEKFLDSSYSI